MWVFTPEMWVFTPGMWVFHSGNVGIHSGNVGISVRECGYSVRDYGYFTPGLWVFTPGLWVFHSGIVGFHSGNVGFRSVNSHGISAIEEVFVKNDPRGGVRPEIEPTGAENSPVFCSCKTHHNNRVLRLKRKFFCTVLTNLSICDF